MESIIMHPIGTINSPYKEARDIPIQGKFKPEVTAWIELDKEYAPGLKDLEGFSHAILLYYFHKSQRSTIVGRPYLEETEHGIFAIRSPHRPNHIGLSIIKIHEIKENKLFFSEVDMLDGTPVLDIKPYIPYFDSRDKVRTGWIARHFRDNQIPDNVILK